jgi:hypothetical protein
MIFCGNFPVLMDTGPIGCSVYRRKNPNQPTSDQSKSPEVLPPKTPKADKITLDFDFEGALSKIHVNVPLKEAIKIPSIKEHFNNFFSGMVEPMDPPIMLQANHFRSQYGVGADSYDEQ